MGSGFFSADYLKKNGASLSGTSIAQDIAALFDYKYDLVSKSYGVDKQESLREDLCHAMRRHIKMVYDAFPFVKGLLDHEDSRKVVLQCFAAQVLKKEGWKTYKHADFASRDTLCTRLLEKDNLQFDGKKCVLGDKSVVKKKHGSPADKFSAARGGNTPSTSNSKKGFFRYREA